jgi:putative tricarboxylic transport membrane protein
MSTDERVTEPVFEEEVEASRPVRITAALVLLVLSVSALVGVFGIRSPDGLAPAGPRFFPFIVCAAWVVLSIAYLVEGLRSEDTERPRDGRRDWFEPLALAGLLVLYAFLVVPLGYLLATALLFFAAARVLGSRNTIRDAIVSVVLVVLVYVAFTQFLDISLPEGVLGL